MTQEYANTLAALKIMNAGEIANLLKAACDELFDCAPEYGAVEDALANLEDAIADVRVQLERAESGELEAEERQNNIDAEADYRFEMQRERED